MIVRCSCRHVYQDQKYGPGFRVHNKTKTGSVRCTVCTNEKPVAAVVKGTFSVARERREPLKQ